MTDILLFVALALLVTVAIVLLRPFVLDEGTLGLKELSIAWSFLKKRQMSKIP